MQVQIEIDTLDPFSLLSHLLGREFPSPGSEEVLSEGTVITFKQHIVRRSLTIGDTLTFLFTFAAGVGAQVAANEITAWLHKAKDQTKRVRIEREEIVIERDKITRIIEKRIEAVGSTKPQRRRKSTQP